MVPGTFPDTGNANILPVWAGRLGNPMVAAHVAADLQCWSL